MGTGQLAVLLVQGFEGHIYPVHPTEKQVLGLPAYPDIFQVPQTPDLAVMVLPTDIVPEKIDECGRAGIDAAVVVSGGFREVGGRGVRLERELIEAARRHEIALVGPNCIGVSNFRIGLNTTYYPYTQEPGGVTIISQSGTYSCHVYGLTRKLGMGLSHTVSVGNSAVVDLSDCLEYFADEPTTRAIALYIEGISDGAKFLRAARKAVRSIPVVGLYVGGTSAGARAGSSHTGALAGADDLYDGLFSQAGILRAYTIEELLDWSWALAELPPLRGDRICVLTNSGGPGASMADACNRAGFLVPLLSDDLQGKVREHMPHTATVVNPVDMTFHMNVADLYEKVPRLLLESGEFDGVVMYGIFGSLLFRYIQSKLEVEIDYHVDDLAPLVIGLLDRFKDFPEEFGKPVIVSSFWGIEDDALAFLADSGIPVFPSPERAVRAMAALRHRGRVLERLGA